MAACTNLSRCPLQMSCSILMICLIIIVSLSSNVYAATTTDAPTTTPTTTTTTATTTLPPATPSPIPANTDIGTCPCDLTGNACDVNCCCDGDCTANDRLAFSRCLDISSSIDSRLCLPQEVVLMENSPYASNVTTDTGLFCLYFNNRAERNYYVNPDLVDMDSTFNRYVENYGSFTFQPDVIRAPEVYPNFYKSGEYIHTVFPSQAQGKLGLPKALSSTYCADSNPLAYLVPESHDCVRPLTSLATECSTLPALDGSTYYQNFRVVTTPSLFQRYTPLNTSISNDTATTGAFVDLSVVTDVYNNTYTIDVTPLTCQEVSGVVLPCTATPPPAPQWDGTNCNNAVTQVTYNVQTNGTGGITSVTARMVLSSIPGTTQRLTQTYASTFQGINDPGTPYQRSGNPGYVEGEPVVAGILNTTVDVDGNVQQEILLGGDRNQWLTLVRASAGGDCLTNVNQDRVSVRFKDDVRSGCFIQTTISNFTDNCQLIQEAIVNALEADTSPNRFVAIFGDSDVKKVGDWTPILVQNRPNPADAASDSASSYCYLSLGMHIQVLYAYVGALVNPQPKIIGISFMYDAKQTVSFRCEGPYCQPGAAALTQRIEISTSVSFLDVSQSAVGFEAERPIFLAKVPYDFFYPFLDNASSPSHGNVLLSLVCAMTVLLRSLLFVT